MPDVWQDLLVTYFLPLSFFNKTYIWYRWKLLQLGLDDQYKRLNEVRKDRVPNTQVFLSDIRLFLTSFIKDFSFFLCKVMQWWNPGLLLWHTMLYLPAPWVCPDFQFTEANQCYFLVYWHPKLYNIIFISVLHLATTFYSESRQKL